jgi:hypothetical protein
LKHRDDIDADFAPSVITGIAAERYFELQATLFEFSRLFNYDERNDRAIAIVGATFLETILAHILRAFLIDNEKEVDKLLQYDHPLGTFSGKITMVYCLGLIYKPLRDGLDLVRKIRNEFDHDLYASFENEKIKSWCSNYFRFAHFIRNFQTQFPCRGAAFELSPAFQSGNNDISNHQSRSDD